MIYRNRRIGALLLLAAWVAMAYGVRYGLMEHTYWVGACAKAPAQLPCEARAGLGSMIHWGVLPWAGLALAVSGWIVRDRHGRLAALAGLVLAVPGLVLYTTSLAAVAVMLAGLRIVQATPEREP